MHPTTVYKNSGKKKKQKTSFKMLKMFAVVRIEPATAVSVLLQPHYPTSAVGACVRRRTQATATVWHSALLLADTLTTLFKDVPSSRALISLLRLLTTALCVRACVYGFVFPPRAHALSLSFSLRCPWQLHNKK